MATTTRQTAIFGVEDWKQIYQTYREADFQSYDFETLRKSFVDYLRLYYPETFNDYIDSSEFIALLDVIAFMGQALAFRTDLNTRENYLDTAERRDSVVKLANLVSYTAKRNTAAQGLLKVFNVTTTENVIDYQGVNLSNVTVDWADPTNPDWQEQFTTIINAALVDTQRVGRPGNRQTILGIRTDEYGINLVPGYLPIVPYTATVDGISMPFEAMSSTSVGEDYLFDDAVGRIEIGGCDVEVVRLGLLVGRLLHVHVVKLDAEGELTSSEDSELGGISAVLAIKSYT